MKKRILTLILLIVIASTGFLGGCRIIITDLDSQPSGTRPDTIFFPSDVDEDFVAPVSPFVKTNIIVHAGGEIDGETYTNSVEAFQSNWAKGNTVFEFDFAYSSEGELIGIHNWEDNLVDPSWGFDNRPSLAEYENYKIAGKFSGMTFKHLLELMSIRPEMAVVLDTKEDDVVAVYEKVVQDTLAYNPNLLSRIVPQLYYRSQYDEVEALYSFDNYVFTLYKTLDGNEAVKSFLSSHPKVSILTVSKTRVGLMSADYISEVQNLGVTVYVHTINSFDTIESLQEKGVNAFYSDSVSEDTYDLRYS